MLWIKYSGGGGFLEEIIFRDQTLAIIKKPDGFYIETFSKVSAPLYLDALLEQFPYIKVTNYSAAVNALKNAPNGPVQFGIEKERISVDVSSDGLEARITLNLPAEELSIDKRRQLVMEVMDELKKAGVSFGITLENLRGKLEPGKPIVIARGIPPINGKNSIVKMYEVTEPKPKIVEDGSVNFYDLDLIHQVKAGDWLGERINPTQGEPGKSVFGTEIKPVAGEFLPLPYDRNSVEMVQEEGKDVLYSLKTGAVHYIGDTIAVYDVLEVDGNIDFNTGNIDFSGYVKIRGSVEENFTVKAQKDIEIMGEYGIGGVDKIESTDGSIYIRGGIAGQNRAKIICKNNLYVKYLADVDVVCGGSVYVGFYIRNSNIKARQVIVDSPRGQIAGGLVETDICVECADIGNRMETRTAIVVHGFNRNQMLLRLEELQNIINENKKELIKLKIMIEKLRDENSKTENDLIQKNIQALRAVQENIRNLERERLSIMNFIRTPGEGAVIVRRRIYPKVKLVIQNKTLEVIEEAAAPTYILKEGSIVQI